MVDTGVRLEPAELRHLDGAVGGHSAQIVACQVDDHHVLRAILGARAQRERLAPVLGRPGPARSRPLDRPRLDPLAAALQEPLRRGRDHVRAAEARERHERRRARAPQARVERERVSVPGGAEALGEVDLEHVTGPDVVDRAAHGLLVAGRVATSFPTAQWVVPRVAGHGTGQRIQQVRAIAVTVQMHRAALVVPLEPGGVAAQGNRRQPEVVDGVDRQRLDLAPQVV